MPLGLLFVIFLARRSFHGHHPQKKKELKHRRKHNKESTRKWEEGRYKRRGGRKNYSSMLRRSSEMTGKWGMLKSSSSSSCSPEARYEADLRFRRPSDSSGVMSRKACRRSTSSTSERKESCEGAPGSACLH